MADLYTEDKLFSKLHKISSPCILRVPSPIFKIHLFELKKSKPIIIKPLLAETAVHVSANITKYDIGPDDSCKEINNRCSDSLYLNVNVLGIKLNCLIDTGSTLSILHPSKYHAMSDY
jgi:hypothetical protein